MFLYILAIKAYFLHGTYYFVHFFKLFYRNEQRNGDSGNRTNYDNINITTTKMK